MYFSVSSRPHVVVHKAVPGSVRDYHDTKDHHDHDQDDLLDVSFFFISLSLHDFSEKNLQGCEKFFFH